MGRRAGGFRVVNRPEGVPTSRYALVVVDGMGMPHLSLTEFHQRLRGELTDGAARSYLNALLPYFTYLDADSWRQRRGDRWDGTPEAVRESVRDYLMQRLGCKVRRDGTCEVVHLTAQSPSTVRVFLSALKRFYSLVIRTRWYQHENPLADPVAQMLLVVSREAERAAGGRPRMPQESGVEEPRRRRPAENYFRLVGEDWVPEPIDDPSLPGRLLAGAKQARLSLRDQIVVRIAFESGARISEVLGLTVGDWRARHCNQEATAFSKGSRGRRVKFLRFSPETAKLLHRYVGGDRKALDPQQRSLEHLADSNPLFLSARRQPYGYKAFIPHWQALCQAAGVELNVHSLRHFYVSQAMRLIYETSATQAEVQRRQEELVRYMAWRSPATLEAYEHYFQAKRHTEIQDQFHARIYAADAHYKRQQPGAAQAAGAGRLGSPQASQNGWESLLALGGERDE